ncbi:MAG: FAD-dependent monooxygenase [Ferruginibacter sp.]
MPICVRKNYCRPFDKFGIKRQRYKSIGRSGHNGRDKKIAIPMHGRSIHNADGTTAYQPYGNDGQFINSVSRGELNKMLMNLAEQSGAEIFFNQKCESIDWKKNEVTFQHSINHEPLTISHELVFGSDGAYSAARLTHQLQHDRFQYQQHFIDFGYKELTIPAASNGGFLMEKHALHICREEIIC